VIFLDVSSSCKSPLPTGVQRVVRGIFRGLKKHGRVVPLVWQEKLGTYCRLSLNQHAHLRGLSLFPGEQRVFSGLSKTSQFLANRLRPFDVARVIREGDFWIQPEIYQDGRIEWTRRNLPEWPGVKKVTVVHDALNWSHPHLSATGRLRRFEDYLETSALYDRVIPVSEYTSQAFDQFWKEHHLEAPETKVVHPVLGWKKRPASRSSNHRQLVLPYISGLEPRKNHFALLDACAGLWDEGYEFKLVLVGKEAPSQGRPIARKIHMLIRQGRNVVWHPQLSDFAIRRLYRNALFTLYPSMQEGFGIPILESLWFGTPCLCHTDGAMAEVARGGGCHQVDVRTVETLQDGLRDLMGNRSLVRRLKREADDRQFLQWDTFVGRMMEGLSEIDGLENSSP
jgi:glycosyltransferase involved in cell wall biosynthesis